MSSVESPEEESLVIQLSNLVARHAGWLDGPSWMRCCERVGNGYFDDSPCVFDGEAMLRALRDGLEQGREKHPVNVEQFERKPRSES
jgi:hypothetical protein